MGLGGTASAQSTLPQVVIEAPKQAPGAPKPKPKQAARQSASSATAIATAAPSTQASRAAQLTAKGIAFDQARGNIFTTIGTASSTISHDTIQDLPQGTNATVEQVLLQAPGVSQDSAASGLLHVRNDHANVQFRINGILLPDGVTGFGSIFDTSFIGSIALVTGALPAEYGLRTVGLVDITTR
ncbi:MAG: ligand-gated channel, partial [Xanthobacteraceae bacterium]